MSKFLHIIYFLLNNFFDKDICISLFNWILALQVLRTQNNCYIYANYKSKSYRKIFSIFGSNNRSRALERIMDKMEDLLYYVRNIQMADLLACIWITIMIFFTIVISVLFAKFIESKPAGRKTVMGKLSRARTTNISRHLSKLFQHD